MHHDTKLFYIFYDKYNKKIYMNSKFIFESILMKPADQDTLCF